MNETSLPLERIMKQGIYIFFMLLIGYVSAFAEQTWIDAANNKEEAKMIIQGIPPPR